MTRAEMEALVRDVCIHYGFPFEVVSVTASPEGWTVRVRGGTDGSRLTELGLPTPNLSTGEHNLHSPLEWTCLEEMVTAVRVLIELAQVWGAAAE